MTQNKIVGEVILKIRDRKRMLISGIETIQSEDWESKESLLYRLLPIYNQISFLDDICYDLLVSIPTMGEDLDKALKKARNNFTSAL